MCRYADRIIVHATSLRDQMIAKGVDKNKLFVISHFDYGYLLEQNADSIIKKSDSRLGQDYALFLGNIAPWKGINSLIEAAKIVRKELGQRFSLVIAGRPYDGYKELDFFGSLSEDDHRYVTVLNKYITSSEIPDLISGSGFIVLPYNGSFQHSASGVITLAYTFSKPVIVSNIPSLTEYVENGKTGLIFEINNSRRLAEHIINLVANSSECIEMGKRASRKVFEEMSLEKCTQALGSLYHIL
jgi:glycosyltransferase involved in cell wall biosynthesis